jgi:ankyrin repeat protein
VCRLWRDATWGVALALAQLLTQHRVDAKTLLSVLRYPTVNHQSIDHAALVMALIESSDYALDGVLTAAIVAGNTDAVRAILSHPRNAPRANGDGGWALRDAAFWGHTDIVKLLLEWPQHAPRANSRSVIDAVGRGHADIVRLLLSSPQDAPLARLKSGKLLTMAASYGHVDVVRLLLEWPQYANNRCGAALVEATRNGHADVVRLLRSVRP